jgi:hypothetical protein
VATVVSLPGCDGPRQARPPALSIQAAPKAPFSFTPRRVTEIGLGGIAVRLGMADRPARSIIEKVRLLVDRHGFPPPKTPRFRGLERLTGGMAVHAKSVWDRDLVDDWFDGDLPPALAAARSGAERDNVRGRLAERARMLAGGVA